MNASAIQSVGSFIDGTSFYRKIYPEYNPSVMWPGQQTYGALRGIAVDSGNGRVPVNTTVLSGARIMSHSSTSGSLDELA